MLLTGIMVVAVETGGLRYENNATLPQGTSAISIGGGGAGANANQETVGAKGEIQLLLDIQDSVAVVENQD